MFRRNIAYQSFFTETQMGCLALVQAILGKLLWIFFRKILIVRFMNTVVAQIQGFLKKGRVVDLILPLVISASILIIFVPLPPTLMDVFLSMNIAIAIIILLTTLFVTKPLDFSIFPTILLATTLFRLVLNIASTRLILTRANIDAEYAAGAVIKNFADFVTSGHIVVGLIIFVIIVVIQFVVITKGATRVSEVAARFTLDAMPGRQMAIDADLNAGIIDEREAKRRREEITQAADFFGAMDGAGKFVRGDAIAGIVITLVNVLGGLFIGMVEYSMSLQEAATIFTHLTIGDGLVSQVPALLISIATGLLVTRSSYSTNLPEQFVGQLLSRPVVLILTAFFLFILTLTDLPKMPLWTIALSSIGLALMMTRKAKVAQQAEENIAAKAEAEKTKQSEEQVEDYLKIDPMELEIGVGLIPLADPARGGDLLDRIHRLRKEVAAEIGIILPRVRIRDSFQLDQLQYRIKIAGQPVALGMVYPDMYLAMDSGVATGQVQGIETLDPAFGTPALWIDGVTKDQAEIFGYTVVEPGAVIATHLLETIRKHADEILTRDATQHLLDELKKSSPAVVDELVSKVLTLGQVQQVLQLLLREQVPIRQLGTILEVLGDYGTKTKDPILLATYVRTKLARTISTRYRDENNVLNVVLLDPALEDQIRAGFEHGEQGLYIRLSPNAIEHLCKKILPELDKLTQMNLPPVVLVNPQIRTALKQMTSATIPGLIVLSYTEITHDTQVVGVGVVTL
ncbi:MAG: flagellar biosynthesis protein FlhA [Planctomycetaceae bacterium]|jgi:flagellar biosynthesis protein FlhA|nr:flagellar biosynthesis protein FlhA [Planctomycetaceae bacterium]